MHARQLRLIYPLTRQTPLRALANVATAWLIWPCCVVEAATDGYLSEIRRRLPAPRASS